MKKLTVLVVLLFTAGIASAQPKNAPKPAPAGGGDKGGGGKVKVYDF